MERVPTGMGQERRSDAGRITPGWRLKHRRGQLGWTQLTLANRLQEVGAWYRGGPKFTSSLISMISRWERDEIVPDAYNAHVLAEALFLEVGELGFPIDPHYMHPPRRRTPLPIG